MSLLKKLIPQPLKNVYHRGVAFVTAASFGFPGRGLTIVGVTGTNGKTTTSEMIYQILLASGKKAALASTIKFALPSGEHINTSKFTTLSPLKLNRFLKEAHREGVTHVVLEVSSHALDQHRTLGIPIAVAALTNLTREHLDYHKSMENYCRAKARLFRKAKAAVINADSDHRDCFVRATHGTKLFYSTKDATADLVAKDIQLDFGKTEFRLGEERIELRLPGLFNVENALAALGAARLLGLDEAAAAKALGAISGIPGRMELVPNNRGLDLVIDYAVTPDAFRKLYASVLPLKIPGTMIIHVFGSCGDRDRGKRPILASIASEKADTVILTNEDPYTENPERILDEVEQGMTTKKDRDYFRIFDRRAAIHKALEMAERGDIVLFTGKGAETSIAYADHREPWNEHQAIEEELAQIGRAE
ncbi:MAG: UDP-N-acetylmuramoyl-L-alanyl-D-glutamate--2,6-diaminopimelate ligase [Candidatus Moraniibacteriota bacterium]